MSKKIFKYLLFIIIPIFISILIKLAFGYSIYITRAIMYVILVFCLLPSDGFVKTSSDYEAKRTNPYFETSERKLEEKSTNFFLIIFLIIAIILCIYLQSNMYN